MTPISRRKAKARILTVGWRSTKPLTVSIETSMTSMAMTMATTMIDDLIGHADGGDDRVERKDYVEHEDLGDHPGEAGAPLTRLALACPPSTLPWISLTALTIRKSPPPKRIRSRPEKERPTVNRGAVRPITQVMANRSPILMIRANASPSRRASALLGSGQAGGQDRDEHHVVDAQHDFHRPEGHQGQQSVGGQEGTHVREILLYQPAPASRVGRYHAASGKVMGRTAGKVTPAAPWAATKARPVASSPIAPNASISVSGVRPVLSKI